MAEVNCCFLGMLGNAAVSWWRANRQTTDFFHINIFMLPQPNRSDENRTGQSRAQFCAQVLHVASFFCVKLGELLLGFDSAFSWGSPGWMDGCMFRWRCGEHLNSSMKQLGFLRFEVKRSQKLLVDPSAFRWQNHCVIIYILTTSWCCFMHGTFRSCFRMYEYM